MNINGNVSRRQPTSEANAYDWPELTLDGVVVIWRGTRSDPRRQLVMRLEGGDPDEIMEYLMAAADSLAPIVAAAAFDRVRDRTGTSTMLGASREYRGEAAC